MPPSRLLRLDEDHAEVGVAALGEHGGPEARVAAADDGEVGDVRALEPRDGALRLLGQVVDPEHGLAGVGEAVLDDGCRGRRRS